MNLNEIDVKKTALLFFDMLNGYYHEAGDEAKRRMEPVVDNAVRLMRAARETGMPIFFARANHRPDSATSAVLLTDTDNGLKPWPGGVVTKRRLPAIGGESSSAVIPELDPRPDDYYIPKYRWSAFYQTYFDLALRARALDTVVISGGATDIGVASTVFSARDRDYNLIIVRDACTSGQSREIHDIFMDRVFPRMGRVRTTDQVLEMIQRARGG